MDIIRKIAEWSQGFLDKSLFVVDIEHRSGSNKISVFIDGDSGVTIESCRLLGRYLSEMLDELDYGDKAYHLEVSSPGTDRPLTMPRQYKKHIGRELLITLNAKNQILGKLVQATDNEIVILIKDKKKLYKDAKEKTIAFEDIVTTEVQISFN